MTTKYDQLARACNLAGLDYETFLKIKAYLPVEAQESEPVAWLINDGFSKKYFSKKPSDEDIKTAKHFNWEILPLYTHPPADKAPADKDADRYRMLKTFMLPVVKFKTEWTGMFCDFTPDKAYAYVDYMNWGTLEDLLDEAIRKAMKG